MGVVKCLSCKQPLPVRGGRLVVGYGFICGGCAYLREYGCNPTTLSRFSAEPLVEQRLFDTTRYKR